MRKKMISLTWDHQVSPVSVKKTSTNICIKSQTVLPSSSHIYLKKINQNVFVYLFCFFYHVQRVRTLQMMKPVIPTSLNRRIKDTAVPLIYQVFFTSKIYSSHNFKSLRGFVSKKCNYVCGSLCPCFTGTSLGRKERHADVWSLTRRRISASPNQEQKDRLVRIKSIRELSGKQSIISKRSSFVPQLSQVPIKPQSHLLSPELRFSSRVSGKSSLSPTSCRSH